MKSITYFTLVSNSGGYGVISKAHELNKLFELLPESDKEFIVHQSGLEQKRFSEQIDAAAKTFVEWRYIHEQSGLVSVSLQFLMLLWVGASKLAKIKRNEQFSNLRTDTR